MNSWYLLSLGLICSSWGLGSLFLKTSQFASFVPPDFIHLSPVFLKVTLYKLLRNRIFIDCVLHLPFYHPYIQRCITIGTKWFHYIPFFHSRLTFLCSVTCSWIAYHLLSFSLSSLSSKCLLTCYTHVSLLLCVPFLHLCSTVSCYFLKMSRF